MKRNLEIMLVLMGGQSVGGMLIDIRAILDGGLIRMRVDVGI